MKHQINSLEVHSNIRNLYSQVVSRATERGLDTENISIYVRPKMALALELGEFLSIEHLSIIRDVPVIQSNSVGQSDIFVYSSDWLSIEDRKFGRWISAEEYLV